MDQSIKNRVGQIWEFHNTPLYHFPMPESQGGMVETEDDTELRDLISHALESNGVLSKIRAQLRASVFLALDHQADLKKKIPLGNLALEDFWQTSAGPLVLSLVREFLEYFQLEFTLSVLDPEARSNGTDKAFLSRERLSQQLHLDSKKREPLLCQVLQQTTSDAKLSSPNAAVAQLSSLEKGRGTEEPSYSANYEPASQATTADELEGSTSANDASGGSVVCTQHSEALIRSSLSNGIQKTDEDDFFSQLPEEPADFFRKLSSSLKLGGNTSTNVIKPPDLITGQANHPKENVNTRTEELERRDETSASISEEIEEDLSGIDDLLNSTKSGLDEFTGLETVSQASGADIDYMESL
ncbi:unnamed protein product [Darwinula stevensoni]|uniref:FGFR1 oncogene partner (FOP) N-terminal dimerisation domain-containing protein n=1 Tax=Darwinula stevensoni TaxID=69355 RepID=A0A7R8XCK8_9CRUS|nr:unnamed protein product [Darwinula stevensoni]CAG0888925.1 unnamed protein product [Darwinula stevensoni]